MTRSPIELSWTAKKVKREQSGTILTISVKKKTKYGHDPPQRAGRHSTYNFLPKLIYRPPMLNLNPSQNGKILTCPKNVRHKIGLEIVFHFDYLVKCWFPLERYSTKDISFASLSQCIHSSVNFLSIQHGGHLSVLCQYFGSDDLQC